MSEVNKEQGWNTADMIQLVGGYMKHWVVWGNHNRKNERDGLHGTEDQQASGMKQDGDRQTKHKHKKEGMYAKG